MKSKLARILRKWADLIDPGTMPNGAVCFHIDARGTDPAVIEQAMKRALAASAAPRIARASQKAIAKPRIRKPKAK
jgi:hypothetical protein